MRIARATVAVALLGGTVSAAAQTVSAPATVETPAQRGVAFSLTAACDMTTVSALSARHPDVGQFVVVASETFSSTTATIDVAVRDSGGRWRCQAADLPAILGRTGTRPLAERRSGDGTTPAGVFPLGTVTAWDGQSFQFFGNRRDPGVRGSYRAVRHEDCWGATPNTPRYQHVVDLPNCPGPDDEWLPRFGDVYSHAAVIGANLDPISGDEPGEPASAAAIFLHRHAYTADGTPKPTSGCVSLALEDLVPTLRSLDPERASHFAIGPVDWLRTAA